MSTQEALKPWYKHRWPWFLIAGPATVVVAGIITTVLAVQTWDGLVADDYYKQGLGINQQKGRDQHALEAGLSAQLMRNGSMVQLFLTAQADKPMPEKLRLRLIHPTLNGLDVQADLVQQGGGLYRGQFAKSPEGRFNVTIEDLGGDWRLHGVWRTDIEDTVVFKAGAEPLLPAKELVKR